MCEGCGAKCISAVDVPVEFVLSPDVADFGFAVFVFVGEVLDEVFEGLKVVGNGWGWFASAEDESF